MRWTWDPDKNRRNQRVHGLGFETAQLVFDDPLAVSRPDLHPAEEQWQTIGAIGDVVVLVVHTWPEWDLAIGDEVGRIIGARKATRHERRTYEDGEF